MSSLTVAERIILHLSRFIDYENEFDVPLDVSQDGISQALRISRAHAAVEVKKLKESGELIEKLAHVKGGKARRKSYFLTPMGFEHSQKLKKFAEKEGIDILPLLDFKRCEPNQLWQSFEPAQQLVFGQACVFRIPVPRDILPESSQSILPLDSEGMVSVPENIRLATLKLLNPELRKEWESSAADYWLDNGNYSERLYHLLQAGRNRESCMLICNQKERWLSTANNDLHNMLMSLEKIPEKYLSGVHEVQAHVAITVGDRVRLSSILDEMMKSPDEKYMALMIQGRMLIDEGDEASGLESLLEAKDLLNETSINLECQIVTALCGLRRFDEAERILKNLLQENIKNSSAEGTDLIYYHMGLLLSRSGKPDEAIRYLSKGIGMSGDGPKNNWYKLMAETYTALGMQAKAQECLTRSKKV